MTYPADLDEWRSAVRSMSETQRVQACGHSAAISVIGDATDDIFGQGDSEEDFDE